jgi:transposase
MGCQKLLPPACGKLPFPAEIAHDVSSPLRLLNILNTIIRRVERPSLQRARDIPAARRLMTVPGVGPITALTFVATIDSPDRFRSAAPVTSFLGLVPIEYSSGEQPRNSPNERE